MAKLACTAVTRATAIATAYSRQAVRTSNWRYRIAAPLNFPRVTVCSSCTTSTAPRDS